jgi:transposase InsO family protein
LNTWCASRGIGLEFIEGGKPAKNEVLERVNGNYCDAVLDGRDSPDLKQVREKTQRWLAEHNTICPHEPYGPSPG